MQNIITILQPIVTMVVSSAPIMYVVVKYLNVSDVERVFMSRKDQRVTRFVDFLIFVLLFTVVIIEIIYSDIPFLVMNKNHQMILCIVSSLIFILLLIIFEIIKVNIPNKWVFVAKSVMLICLFLTVIICGKVKKNDFVTFGRIVLYCTVGSVLFSTLMLESLVGFKEKACRIRFKYDNKWMYIYCRLDDENILCGTNEYFSGRDNEFQVIPYKEFEKKNVLFTGKDRIVKRGRRISHLHR